jgi:asparagine synthase (glutamine-hydrolysing)
MCGIFALFNKYRQITQTERLYGNKIRHRGPDNTRYVEFKDGHIVLGFHRLAINDLSSLGDQPLELDERYYLICNGEIYNHRELAQKYNIITKSGSDCEIILHLYKKIGASQTLKELSGYFAFVLLDVDENKMILARDPIGVRALYYAHRSDESELSVCSELKGIPTEQYPIAQQFPPGKWLEYDLNASVSSSSMHTYYNYEYPSIPSSIISIESQLMKMRSLFENAVNKRFMTDRPFGVFLSGGLDSSLVAALVAKKNAPNKIHSFSIGMTGSTDLAKARIVANHIGSIHHEVIVSAQEMLDAQPEVIRALETYDTTTIRAGTPMYLLSKYIKENTNIVVVFSGEGSDEASGSYLYFHNAPSSTEFQDECVRLLRDLSYFDCLRCDKAVAAHGLEVRVPFLDTEFLYEYMRVPVEWKQPRNGMEKWFIRQAFEGTGLLPHEILWRKKEAFSDGVSSTEKSWFQIIQTHVDSIIPDSEFLSKRDEMIPNPPVLKESYYYRKLFDEYFPDCAHTIPYYWLPKWSGNTSDPSARVLSVYN